jgi:hypothetical protein
MSATSPAQPAGTAGGWQVLVATERGAAHGASGLPNQDAVAEHPLGSRGAVVAVADGHGHPRHFRSDRGARLAVRTACQQVRLQAGWLAGLASAGQAQQEMPRVLVPAVTGSWRDAVRGDAAAESLTPAEQSAHPPGDDLLIAYGTTLLLAVTWERWLLLAQIGDGDILAVRPDGQPLLPVPADPLLDGHHTTSLCNPSAEQAFRVAVVDLSDTALAGVLLATDGYGNAQAAERWEGAVSADLAELIRERSPEWLAGQLPLWAQLCASAEGSADDTTLALLLAPRRTGDGAARGAASTLPAAHPATLPTTLPVTESAHPAGGPS